MDEAESDNVFVCRWTKKKAGYEMRVDSHPDLVVQAATFEGAEAEVLDLIGDHTGIITPGLEYSPPAPKGAIQAKFEGPGIVALSGNDVADVVPDFSYLYEGGICGSCKRGIGERSALPMRVPIHSNADGISVRLRMRGTYGSMSVSIFSEEFLAHLTSEEIYGFEWRPVELETKKKKRYFEPIGHQVLPTVRAKGLFKESERFYEDGFICEECGRRELIGLPQGGAGILYFLGESDLPSPLPSCFLAGQTADLNLCMTKSRWQQLLGKPGTKSVASNPVGVVREKDLNRNPLMEWLPKVTSEDE